MGRWSRSLALLTSSGRSLSVKSLFHFFQQLRCVPNHQLHRSCAYNIHNLLRLTTLTTTVMIQYNNDDNVFYSFHMYLTNNLHTKQQRLWCCHQDSASATVRPTDPINVAQPPGSRRSFDQAHQFEPENCLNWQS